MELIELILGVKGWGLHPIYFINFVLKLTLCVYNHAHESGLGVLSIAYNLVKEELVSLVY